MTKTAAEVGAEALELLGVKPIGQTADTRDSTVAESLYTALLAELSDREDMAFEWGEDAIPDALFMPLAGMLAARLAPRYDKQFDGSGYERLLRRYVFDDDRVEGQPVAGLFF